MPHTVKKAPPMKATRRRKMQVLGTGETASVLPQAIREKTCPRCPHTTHASTHDIVPGPPPVGMHRYQKTERPYLKEFLRQ
jgi:hypothetical protein